MSLLSPALHPTGFPHGIPTVPIWDGATVYFDPGLAVYLISGSATRLTRVCGNGTLYCVRLGNKLTDAAKWFYRVKKLKSTAAWSAFTTPADPGDPESEDTPYPAHTEHYFQSRDGPEKKLIIPSDPSTYTQDGGIFIEGASGEGIVYFGGGIGSILSDIVKGADGYYYGNAQALIYSTYFLSGVGTHYDAMSDTYTPVYAADSGLVVVFHGWNGDYSIPLYRGEFVDDLTNPSLDSIELDITGYFAYDGLFDPDTGHYIG